MAFSRARPRLRDRLTGLDWIDCDECSLFLLQSSSLRDATGVDDDDHDARASLRYASTNRRHLFVRPSPEIRNRPDARTVHGRTGVSLSRLTTVTVFVFRSRSDIRRGWLRRVVRRASFRPDPVRDSTDRRRGTSVYARRMKCSLIPKSNQPTTPRLETSPNSSTNHASRPSTAPSHRPRGVHHLFHRYRRPLRHLLPFSSLRGARARPGRLSRPSAPRRSRRRLLLIPVSATDKALDRTRIHFIVLEILVRFVVARPSVSAAVVTTRRGRCKDSNQHHESHQTRQDGRMTGVQRIYRYVSTVSTYTCVIL